MNSSSVNVGDLGGIYFSSSSFLLEWECFDFFVNVFSTSSTALLII